jgi:site-specific DNA-methyltransferase (adenine-specific)
MRVCPKCGYEDKLIEGDCMEILPTFPDASVDLILTDPPYFLPVESYVGVRGDGYAKRTLADTSILKGYFKGLFEECGRILKNNGTFYIFCDAQSYPIFYEVMYPYCQHVRLIIWDKILSYNGFTWRHQHELIAWGEREKTERISTGDGDIIKQRGVLQENRNHPAEKPILLLCKLIAKSTKPHDIILDPFVGSGSTCVAALKLERHFLGIELESTYFQIAKERIEKTPNQTKLFDVQQKEKPQK